MCGLRSTLGILLLPRKARGHPALISVMYYYPCLKCVKLWHKKWIYQRQKAEKVSTPVDLL